MRLVVKASASRQRFLWWTQGFLFTLGFLLLGYCAYVEVDAWWFQRMETRALDLSLHNRLPGEEGATPVPAPVPIPDHGLIGRIEIERLGLSAMIVEGADDASLRRAVGHISGTALPGQTGNVGMAGHRDTFFRPLRNIKRDDIITLTTLRGNYAYRVVSTRIVKPSDVAVLNPDGTEVLTLVTCYPFYFVGSAPDRFIVRAKRITVKPSPVKPS
jgi:sortase A